jgi:hypothetical protein
VDVDELWVEPEVTIEIKRLVSANGDGSPEALVIRIADGRRHRKAVQRASQDDHDELAIARNGGECGRGQKYSAKTKRASKEAAA